MFFIIFIFCWRVDSSGSSGSLGGVGGFCLICSVCCQFYEFNVVFLCEFEFV